MKVFLIVLAVLVAILSIYFLMKSKSDKKPLLELIYFNPESLTAKIRTPFGVEIYDVGKNAPIGVLKSNKDFELEATKNDKIYKIVLISWDESEKRYLTTLSFNKENKTYTFEQTKISEQ